MSEENTEPTLTEQQLMLLENQIIGHFIKRGILSYASMADHLYLITKHLDPEPEAAAPPKIYEALAKL